MSAAPATIIDMETPAAPAEFGGGAPSIIAAEIDVQIATAKRFPRSIARFRANLQAQATTDLSIARQCHYAVPRGGKSIEGPSIRFAEMVLQAWGNASVGTRVVAELNHFVVAQGVFYDHENNVRVVEDVQRRITKANGERYDIDMIGVAGAAARSIGLRNAILRGVPKALWWDGYLAATKTIVGDIKTMKQRREDMLGFFRALGVVDAQVFAALGLAGLADIGPEHMLTLAGFRTSIEDEGKDPEQIFPPAETKASRTTAKPPPAQAPDAASSVPPPQPPTPGGQTDAASGNLASAAERTTPPPGGRPEDGGGRQPGTASAVQSFRLDVGQPRGCAGLVRRVPRRTRRCW